MLSACQAIISNVCMLREFLTLSFVYDFLAMLKPLLGYL
jgi:hypothetical protein